MEKKIMKKAETLEREYSLEYAREYIFSGCF